MGRPKSETTKGYTYRLLRHNPHIFYNVKNPTKSQISMGIKIGKGWQESTETIIKIMNKYLEEKNLTHGDIEITNIETDTDGYINLQFNPEAYKDNEIENETIKYLNQTLQELTLSTCEQCGKHAKIRAYQDGKKQYCDRHHKIELMKKKRIVDKLAEK